jgi:hypothetical protein
MTRHAFTGNVGAAQVPGPVLPKPAHRAWTLALLAIALSAGLSAQPFEGYVIDKITQAPLAGVYITMFCMANASPAISDAAGHFTVTDAGQSSQHCANFSVARAGYLRRNMFTEATAGQPAPNLRIVMTPQSVIAGKIVDEDGFPVEGAQVSILRYRIVDGQRKLEHAWTENPNRQSNDLGEYRIGGLHAGKYYVRVAATGSASRWDETYIPQFYPSASTPDEATLVELKAGDQRTDLNFHLVRRKGMTVEGRLIVPEGADARSLSVDLRSADDFMVFAGSRSVAPGDGSFVISHVAPGSYVLHVQSPGVPSGNGRFGASLPVTVGQSDLRDLVVNCHAVQPQDIAGKIAYDGEAAQRASKVSLRFMDGSIHEGPADADGSFQIKAVPAGQATVHVMGNFNGVPSGEMAFSLPQGTRPTRSLHQLELDGGPVEPLQITVKAPEPAVPTSLRVADATGQPAGGVTLLFVGSTPEHRELVPMDAAGHRERFGLVPDVYRVYLADDDPVYDFSVLDDPEFMTAHANDFPPVHIVAGENPPIVLTMRR